MIKAKYLCVDMDVYTQQGLLVEGESRNGMLTMTEDNERFMFEEVITPKKTRHATLWSGHRINVKKNMYDQLCVYFRKLELTPNLDVKAVAKEIRQELLTAKRELTINS